MPDTLGVTIILLVIVAYIVIRLRSSRQRRRKWAQTWSELASQTGLEFSGVGLGLWRRSAITPVSGKYRGRHVSISGLVAWVPDGGSDNYGSSPVDYTSISLQVKNTVGCRLYIRPRSFMWGIFRHDRGSVSGNEDFDRRFHTEGDPAALLQEALQLMVPNSVLFLSPDTLVRPGQSRLSEVAWSIESIWLQGSELNCTQSGVPTHVPGQVALLNLLCDLAELAEQVE